MTAGTPPTAPGDAPAAALRQITEALQLQASPSQIDALARYLALLQRWNGTYNLTAVRDPAAMLHQHLADCLAVLPALARQPTARRVLDVGSGGGLPGVVIALMRPDLDVTCVDTVGKKAAFIRQVAVELGLRQLHAVHARVEQLRHGPYDLITARAFATLADLVTLTRSQLGPGGCWMAMKGRVPDDEIDTLPADVEVFHVEPLAIPGLDAQRCLVWLRPHHEAAPAP